MAIGTITSGNPSKTNAGPWNLDLLTFPGDGAYPTGGTPGFQALVRAKLGDNRTILAVIGQDCGGYVPVYDVAADKLKVYKSAASAVPMVEVTAAANLAAVPFTVLVASM